MGQGKRRRAGIRWDVVVDKTWKYIGANQEETPFVDKSGGERDRSKIKYIKG